MAFELRPREWDLLTVLLIALRPADECSVQGARRALARAEILVSRARAAESPRRRARSPQRART